VGISLAPNGNHRRVRFGEADEATRQQIEAIRDIDRLEDLTERLVIVSSWDELMA
jgi:hypothetical protein